jgi:hypothetical protein
MYMDRRWPSGLSAKNDQTGDFAGLYETIHSDMLAA